jgi:hypothetical protein
LPGLRAPERAPAGDDTSTAIVFSIPYTAPRARSWLDRPLRIRNLGIVFGALALLFVLTAQPNHYVVDNLFAWFWRPTAVLRSWRSPWGTQGGLGAARPDFSPVFVGGIAIVRGLGASAAIAERLAHAVLLVTAALGAVQVVRLFAPRVRALHAIAGLLYMVNPYSATFVVPSALFLNYALAPWFVYVVVRGVRGETGRARWAACFALLVFVAGMSNIPGLGWALLPVVPALVYVVGIERRARTRDAVAFFALAGMLTLLVMAGGLVKMRLGAPRLAENLNNTETLGVVSIASSWSESWRGLGFWLSYWSDAHGYAIERTKSLFTSPALVAATFAWPVGALASLRVSRWRPRLVFAAIAIAALVGMVGIYPYTQPTPFGRVLRVAYDHFPSLYGFRNSYKAGAGLMLGLSVLLAIGIVSTVRRWTHPAMRATLVVATLALLVATTYPFWTGGLYGRGGSTRPTSVPAYYPAAFSWLDAHLGDSRVLILPGTANSWYRWGYVGDDIVDAYMTHDYVLRGLLPLSNTEANSIVAAIDDRVNDGTLQPGMLGPLARRLGIRYVMLRNDLDWQRSERPRPAALAPVRHDPDLARVATFGNPGENVTSLLDTSPQAHTEQDLPPVEIYEVRGSGEPPRVVSADHSILLSGDGAAWPLLARNGALNGSQGVISTRTLDRSTLESELEGGAGVVVSDTNRRATSFVTQTSQETSYTLARSDTPARGLAVTNDASSAQTVATFTDATDVREISATSRSAPDGRPALAFDGDKQTAWLADAFSPPDARLRVDLRVPRVVSHANLIAARPLGEGRNLTGVKLRFSDGTTVPVGLENGSASVDFAPRRTDWIEIVIDRVAGPGVRPIGLAEVSFPGIALDESIALPEDVFTLAAGSASASRMLERAPFRYQFERQRTATSDIEARLDRTFRVAGTHEFDAAGTLELDRSVSDSLVDHVFGGPSGAAGSARYDVRLANSGSNAFDGNLATGWIAPPTIGTSLMLRFPSQPVLHLSIVARSGPGLSRLTGVHVDIGNVRRDVALAPTSSCPVGLVADPHPCTLVGEVDIPRTVATQARIAIAAIDARPGAFGAAPVRIDEVMLNFRPNPTSVSGVSNDALGGCVDDIVRIDGRSVPVRIHGTRQDLLAGKPVSFSGCGSTVLGSGSHALRTMVPVDDLTLADGPRSSTRTSSGTSSGSVALLARSASAENLRVSAPAGSTLIGGFSFDGNWRATLDGRRLSGPISVDGQSAWVLPRPLANENVHFSYAPQKSYDIALLVSLAGLLTCAFLLWRTRSGRRA